MNLPGQSVHLHLLHVLGALSVVISETATPGAIDSYEITGASAVTEKSTGELACCRLVATRWLDDSVKLREVLPTVSGISYSRQSIIGPFFILT